MAAAGTLENTLLSMALLVVLADMPSDTAGACHVNRVGVDVSHMSENGRKGLRISGRVGECPGHMP